MKFLISIPILGCLAVMKGADAAECRGDNLLTALLRHKPDSDAFCSEYISIPATAIITVYTSTCTLSTYTAVPTTVHQFYLHNLQREQNPNTVTPISYNTVAPTPVSIPGGPQYYGWQYWRRDKRGTPFEPETGAMQPTPVVEAEVVMQQPTLAPELLRRTQPLPTYLAATYPASRISSGCSCLSVTAAATSTIYQATLSVQVTTTCTQYNRLPEQTYPAFCAPSLHVNNPYPAAHPSYVVVPNFTVPSKMDCCAACGNVFNCAWWKFTFPPNSANGWAPGQCRYAYYIGNTSDAGAGAGGVPKVCPNGMTRAIDNPDWTHVGEYENINKDGYNLGSCGGGSNVFQSTWGGGPPPDSYLHTCGGWNGEPSRNPAGCSV